MAITYIDLNHTTKSDHHLSCCSWGTTPRFHHGPSKSLVKAVMSYLTLLSMEILSQEGRILSESNPILSQGRMLSESSSLIKVLHRNILPKCAMFFLGMDKKAGFIWQVPIDILEWKFWRCTLIGILWGSRVPSSDKTSCREPASAWWMHTTIINSLKTLVTSCKIKFFETVAQS